MVPKDVLHISACVGEVQAAAIGRKPDIAASIRNDTGYVARAQRAGNSGLEGKLVKLPCRRIENIRPATMGSDPDATIRPGIQTHDARGTQSSLASREHWITCEAAVSREA